MSLPAHSTRAVAPTIPRGSQRFGHVAEFQPFERHRRGESVLIPPPDAVELVLHALELIGRAVHPLVRAVGNRLVHHFIREHVVRAAHPFAHVQGALDVADALAGFFELLRRRIPPCHQVEHQCVFLVDHRPVAALGREAALGDRIAKRREVLGAHGELGLPLGRCVVVVRGVLQGGAGVVVAAAPRARGVADGHALERARAVRRQFEAARGIEKIGRVAADFRGQPLAAFREPVAEPLAVRHVFEEPQHGRRIAPLERSTDIRLTQESFLHALEGERERDACGYRVQSQLVAEHVGLEHDARVADAQHGPQREDGLVLGELPHEAVELAAFHQVILAARHGAFEAGGVLVQEIVVHVFAADGFAVLENLAHEVARAERAHLVDHVHEDRCAVFVERRRARAHVLGGLVHERAERLGVRPGGFRLAAGGDGLDVLAAQDGRHPAAPADAVAALAPCVRHGREAHLVLARRADGEHVRPALCLGDGVARLANPFSLQMACVPERHAFFGQHEIDEGIRLSVENDGVEPGALERYGPGAPEGGVEEKPGERADGGGARAARAGDCGIRIGPHGEDDDVFRRQRVGAGFQVVPEDLGAEAVSANKLAAHLLAEFLDAGCAVAEVDVQYFPLVSEHRFPHANDRSLLESLV